MHLYTTQLRFRERCCCWCRKLPILTWTNVLAMSDGVSHYAPLTVIQLELHKNVGQRRISIVMGNAQNRWVTCSSFANLEIRDG